MTPNVDGDSIPVEPDVAADAPGSELRAALMREGAERYEMLKPLGIGGMGEVRLYKDRRIGREVAGKTMRPDRDSDDARKRFVREARVQGQLEHPAIVPVYDLGFSEGTVYFTMRRVRGMTLGDVLEDLARNDPVITQRYTRRKLLTAFVSVCLAVHYAHTRGVIHRDLKPANIMLGDFGEVYVLDWGLAKLLAPDAEGEDAALEPDTTKQGIVVGSMGYMTPEQVRGDNSAVDARSDVYALGAILFEILALQPLHTTRSIAEIARATLAGVDARPSSRVPFVPPELDAVCVRATALSPADRFATAREMGDAIERYLDDQLDAERRRALAAEHARAADADIARARAPESTAEQAEAARAEAMRSVVTALAMNPEQPDARRAMFELLTETPTKLSAHAEAELDRMEAAKRAEGARLGLRAFGSFLLCLPIMALLGIRSWPMALLGTVLTLASMGVNAWSLRSGRTGTGPLVALLALQFATLATASSWLGPFVLVPVASAVTTVVYALHVRPYERPVVAVMGMLAVLLPFGLELAGLVPPSMEFVQGALVLRPRALALPRTGTLLALMYTSTTFVVGSTLIAARLRDTLSKAERTIFVQAWHLRKLLPGEPPRPPDRPAPAAAAAATV